MRDSSVQTISFHSATHILLSSYHWWRRRLWFCVRVDQAMAFDNACHVWSRIIMLKYGCAQAPKASSLHGVSRLESDHREVADRCVTRQYRQFHSILPLTSFFHRTIGGGDVYGSASRVDQAMAFDNACHVWSRIIMLKYGCAQAPKASSLHGVSRLESDHREVADRCVTRQYRQFHSILPLTSFFHRTIGGGDVYGSASRVDQAMDVLRTDHSAVNGVEWYAQTLNDALQTQCDVTDRSVTGMRTICLSSREVVH
ncbi:hypothetical protein TNCV_2418631 [Trichonephila clavipes]|nr:hypothetical protein TNCV_2418631 [Trichonephila clavipes]